MLDGKENYRGLVDAWELYDNSGMTPVLIAEEGNE